MPSFSKSHHIAGAMWMMASGLLFVAVYILVRLLGSDMSAVQAAFIRYCFGLIMLAPVLMKMRWSRVRSLNLSLYAYRGVVHGAAVILWFYAMARIPIAEVTAIGYTTPIYIAIGAVLIFKEKIHARRIAAIIVGFVGTLIILRPGFEQIQDGALAQFIAAFLFAVSFLFTKKLTKTEHSGDILVMLTIFCTLALLPGALFQWRTPTLIELSWLALVAVFATAGHYTITKAIAAAPLTVIQPFSFLQLVWAIVFGFLLFDEIPDKWVLIGALIIVGSVSYISHRESIANKNQKAIATPKE